MVEDLRWVRVVLAVSIHVVIIACAAWDLLAIGFQRDEYTVSSLIQRWAIENPVLPLAVGVLMGHLFWPVK